MQTVKKNRWLDLLAYQFVADLRAGVEETEVVCAWGGEEVSVRSDVLIDNPAELCWKRKQWESFLAVVEWGSLNGK